MTHTQHRRSRTGRRFLLAVAVLGVASVYALSAHRVWGQVGDAVSSGVVAPTTATTSLAPVQGASTTPPASLDSTRICPAWLNDFIRFGAANNPDVVRNLQLFLNAFEGSNLFVSGTYDAPTLAAVESYQRRYAAEVLAPWGITEPTGYVYLTTRKKVNEQFCGSLRTFPLTSAEEQIIAESRASLQTPDSVTPKPVTPPSTGSPTSSSGGAGGLAEGISLDGGLPGTGTTSPIDVGEDPSADSGRLSTVTPGTFFTGLLAGIPDVEVPFVLAVIAAIILCLGGFILLRSFRASPMEPEESVILSAPASTTVTTVVKREETDRPVTPADHGASTVPLSSETVINLPGGTNTTPRATQPSEDAKRRTDPDRT